MGAGKPFTIGDWVYIDKLSDPWHGKYVRITDAVDYYVGFSSSKEFELESGYGKRMFKERELSWERRDSVAYGAHHGHEVIENEAGGKKFKYCRKCKTEVFD